MKSYVDGYNPRVTVRGGLAKARPVIQSHHIDGPLLYFRDGQLHWLTLWERFLFAFGWTDADKLERKRRPKLLKAIGQ